MKENKDCIFCKIIKGEIPSYKIYEDDNFLAFLDIQPHAQGHTIIIPKIHTVSIFNLSDDLTKKINLIIKNSFGEEMITLYFSPSINL